MNFTDAHNHLHDHRLGDPEPVIRKMREAGIVRCVVNATCEDDWQAVGRLREHHPDLILPAYGVHPWKAHEAKPGWDERLRELLESDPESSIGECGLDRWVENPQIEAQNAVFETQLRIAHELDRPVSVHCLKAWQPLFDSFERVPPPRRWILHSFNGSSEIAKRLLSTGAYFSFSGYFLLPRKAKLIENYRELPLDRLLLETDAPDMLPPDQQILHPLPDRTNHPANLPAIAEGFAAALEISTTALMERVAANFRRCFGKT
jgi:TatD DNase family protein